MVPMDWTGRDHYLSSIDEKTKPKAFWIELQQLLQLQPSCLTQNSEQPRVTEHQMRGSKVTSVPWSPEPSSVDGNFLWAALKESRQLPIQSTARYLVEECSVCPGRCVHSKAAGFRGQSNSDSGPSSAGFCANTASAQKWNYGFQNIPSHELWFVLINLIFFPIP